MVDLGAHLQRLREGAGADGRDHELLKIDRVVGVHAAVEHVHRRHRQHPRLGAAEVPPQRFARFGGRGARDGERHAEDGVGAEPRLAVGAVEREERLVEAALIARVAPGDRGGDLLVDVADGAGDALAAERPLAVAQLERLAAPGRRPRRHRRAPAGPGRQRDIDFNGGIAAAVEDLARVHGLDGAHSHSGRRRRGPSPGAVCE